MSSAQQWSCDKCTLKQPSNVTECGACHNRNPFVAREDNPAKSSHQESHVISTHLSTLKKIDIGLHNHYQSLGRFDYLNENNKGKFLVFCEEEGFDQDTVIEELDGDVEDCGFLEFLINDNFPYPHNFNTKHTNISLQKEFIFNLIKESYNAKNISVQSLKPTQDYHNIDEKSNNNNNDQTVESVCNALKRFYTIMNKPYDQIFSKYCAENDISNIREELQSVPHECILTDFDPFFPFENRLYNKDKSIKEAFIFDLIQSCLNDPNKQFDAKLPHCFLSNATIKYFYSITQTEYEKTRQLYRQQCPSLWYAGGMTTDKCFSYMCAIGVKYKFHYLEYLVDEYHRASITHNKTIATKTGAMTVHKWSKIHPHFKVLEKIQFNFPWKDNNDSKQIIASTAYDIAVGAVESYNKRCVPKLQIHNIMCINDSLEIVARYIDAFSGFIKALLHMSTASNMPICPFEIDLCIGYGKHYNQDKIMRQNNYSDDDDYDYDYDYELAQKKKDKIDLEYIDIIGDIEAKLKINNLKYYLGSQKPSQLNDYEYMTWRGLERIFRAFIEKHKLLKDTGKHNPEMYLHNKRLIVFVDRRQTNTNNNTMGDNVWMYEPPKNCKNIPYDAVPEWYVNASKTCLLPNMEYGDGKQAEKGNAEIENDENEYEEDEFKIKENKIQDSNINSSFHCKGQVLTLSFIVKQSNTIKAYLYWNGMMIRFYPNDIKTILKGIINMKWNNGYDLDISEKSLNEKFLHKKDKGIEPNDLDAIVERIQKSMQDIYINPF